MATIKPPQEKIENKKPVKIAPEKTSDTKILSKPSPTESVNLNLNVPNSLKIEYKVFCTQQGKTMNSVFEEMFNEYKSKF